MATEGIEAVFLETHDRGRATKFYPQLGFEDTHYGTREMIVRDPDGRLWNLQAPVRDRGRS